MYTFCDFRSGKKTMFYLQILQRLNSQIRLNWSKPTGADRSPTGRRPWTELCKDAVEGPAEGPCRFCNAIFFMRQVSKSAPIEAFLAAADEAVADSSTYAVEAHGTEAKISIGQCEWFFFNAFEDNCKAVEVKISDREMYIIIKLTLCVENKGVFSRGWYK